mmetsp:Transcript_72135/g.234330  ORF Transcript_72135/g.234330 Transcript_72135/m.234330 type:complete len:239 (-) Transcript_72135:235-951(-)
MELVVNLTLVEGKLVRVVHPHLLRPHGIIVVARAPQELQAPIVGGLDLLEEGRVHAAGQADGRSILRAPVLWVVTSVLQLCRVVQVILGELTHFALRDFDVHHLRVSHAAVIGRHRNVVVANAALVTDLSAPRVAGQGGDGGAVAPQERDLLLDDLVLDVPEAALPEEHAHVALCPGRFRATCGHGNDHSQGSEQAAKPAGRNRRGVGNRRAEAGWLRPKRGKHLLLRGAARRGRGFD